MKGVYYLFGLLALFGVVFAAAATLDVQGGTIQVGEDLDLTCDEAVRVAGWGYEADDQKVYSVRIFDIDKDCADSDPAQKELFVTITGTTGDFPYTANVKLPTDGGAGDLDTTVGEVGVSVPFGPALAENVTDIHIAIESDASP